MANSVETVYTANTGLITISTANSNLDGGGTLETIITGSANGTLIKTLIIKAQTDTSHGMIRLFVQKSGGSNTLLREIPVPTVIKSDRDPSYMSVINLNYTLENSERLKASTENADTFNLIAEAFDISYSTGSEYIGSSLEWFRLEKCIN